VSAARRWVERMDEARMTDRTPALEPRPNGGAGGGRLELAVVVIISVAGLATSFAGYEASLWNREQAIAFGRAGGDRVVGTRAALDASVSRTMAVDLFSAWMEAKAAGKSDLAADYERRFPPELKPAFDEWLAQRPFENPKAAPSPFRLPAYRQQGLTEAERLDAKAQAEFAAGQRASAYSASFTRAGVILATSMFFGGVGPVFKARYLRMALGAMAFISCGFGLAQVFTLPVLSLHF
jgi:hypothetical protein